MTKTLSLNPEISGGQPPRVSPEAAGQMLQIALAAIANVERTDDQPTA